MKLALLATIVAFGGSIAGFGITAGVSSDDRRPEMSAGPPMEDVVVRGTDRDCPKAVAAEKA